LIFIVVYGVWKGRGSKDLKGYLLANRSMKWFTVALSIMATQASAITFLSGPGQAYTDGMRFVQFYFGLPIAMIILCITAIPIYHRLNIYTAYEYLENRFNFKTRALASFLFLIQRGLAAGLTMFAPSIILSVILGWNLYLTNLIVGLMVILYTASGGTKAVNMTHFYQMLIIMIGMLAACVVVIRLLPSDISFLDASHIAGKMGKLNTIDFKFDLTNRYNVWSGIIGGLFLQLSYFGTDQSQVQRYLTGKSITHSRLGLLFNGFIKIPMQFFILFIGALVFVFYLFQTPPLFFNSVETQEIRSSAYADQYIDLENEHEMISVQRQEQLRSLLSAIKNSDEEQIAQIEKKLDTTGEKLSRVRQQAVTLLQANNPQMDPSDTNFIFLSFVVNFLPVGLVGLVIAAILSASMSSTSGELNALASTTVIDIYKRAIKRQSSEQHYLKASKLITIAWGVYAIILAQYASRLGSLIEAVNILGSLFYGTILGIFLVAFYLKWIEGNATFYAAIFAEGAVVICFVFTDLSFLWYNVVGCLGVILFSMILQPFINKFG
jgi:SSS family transporter